MQFPVADMNESTPPSVRFDLEPVDGERGLELLLSKTTYGVVDTTPLRRDFFGSPEYRLTKKQAKTIHDLIQPGAGYIMVNLKRLYRVLPKYTTG